MLTDRKKAALMVKILHHLTARFKEHAILKGGMELALFSSGRSTNDLDFVFVPYKSKNDIAKNVLECLENLPDGPHIVSISLNSKNAKFDVSTNGISVEVEVSVADTMESIAINTAPLAKPHGISPQIIRVMKPEIALAHKIAAWNERRLLRDLYDMYFWFGVQKFSPNLEILRTRLNAIESRLPSMRKKNKMTIEDLCNEISKALNTLTQNDLNRELTSISPDEREGLEAAMRGQLRLLIANLLKFSD